MITTRKPPAIGQIGCGRWGRLILRDLCALGANVSVVARSETSASAARQGGAQRVVPGIEDLGPVDGLVVCTSTSTHFEVLEDLIRRHPNTPIYCEKCLTASVPQAETLVERAGSRLFVMDKWRYHSGVLALAALARSGELGKVRGIKTVRIGTGSPHRDVDPIWILMPHDLAIALEVLGAIPEPVAAAAERLGSTAWGMVAQLGTEPWATCHVSACAARNERSITVYFDDAAAIVDDSYAEFLTIVRPETAWEISDPLERRPIEVNMPLKTELDAFLSYVTGNGPAPKSSAGEALEIVRTIARLRVLAGLEGGAAWK